MATENKRVAAYLPQALYDLLEDFKKENSLSESKAIISILAAHFGVAQEVNQKVAHQFVTVEQFNELQDKVAHLSKSLDELRTLSESTQQKNKSDSNSELLDESQEEAFPPGQKTIFEAVSSDEFGNSSSELKSNLPGPMSEADLVERFQVETCRSIGNRRRKCKDDLAKFLAWTREQDKEGVGWEYHPDDKLYYPVP